MADEDYGPRPPWMTQERYDQIKEWREVSCRGFNTFEYEDFMEYKGVSSKELRAIIPRHI